MRDNRDNKAPKDDIKDKLVAINRVTKVVKARRSKKVAEINSVRD